MYILVIGNAAVNVRFLVRVYNDEGQSDGGVGRWSAILSHTLPIPLDEILKGQHLWTYMSVDTCMVQDLCCRLLAHNTLILSNTLGFQIYTI